MPFVQKCFIFYYIPNAGWVLESSLALFFIQTQLVKPPDGRDDILLVVKNLMLIINSTVLLHT